MRCTLNVNCIESNALLHETRVFAIDLSPQNQNYWGRGQKWALNRNTFEDLTISLRITHCRRIFKVLLQLRLALLEKDLHVLQHQHFICVSYPDNMDCILNQRLRPLITFPARTIIKRHMHIPSQFKAKYPGTRIIINCTDLH